MKRRFVIVAVLLLSTVAAPSAAQVTPTEIERLIAIGKANRLKDVSYSCTAKRASLNMMGGGLLPLAVGASMNKGKTSYTVTVVSNRGMIARMAWSATQAGKSFSATDVQPDLLKDGLYAIVSPNLPNAKSKESPVLPDAVSDFRFRTDGNRTVLLSVKDSSEEQRTWKNAAGATVDYSEQLFTLNHVALEKAEVIRQSEMNYRNPSNNTDIVLVTSDGDRTCVGVDYGKIRGLVGKKAK